MSNFDVFADSVIKQSRDLATDALQSYKAELELDTKAFLDQTRANLEAWAEALAKGEMTKLEFTGLVNGEKALAQMHALTMAGIAATRLQRLRDGLIKIVIDTAFDTFL